MSEATRPLRSPHRARLVPTVVAVAGLLVLAAISSSCSGIGAGGQASNTACASKLAQAAISGSVPGLWNCLTPELQTNLEAAGVAPGDASLVPQPFASGYVLLGASANEVSYEITLTRTMAQQQGFHYMALVVWVDKNGKITNFSTGSSPS